MFYQTERFFNLTSNKPCIHEAKCFIKMLVDPKDHSPMIPKASQINNLKSTLSEG